MRRISAPFRFLALVIVMSACTPLHALSQDLAAETPPLGQPATTASILRRPGWNLVAPPLTPEDPAPAAVFAAIAEKYDPAYAYDAWIRPIRGKNLDPQAPPAANDLSAISAEHGLWIRATPDATLTITGRHQRKPASRCAPART